MGIPGWLAMKVESLKALEGFDPMTKAIAFKEGTVKVKTLKVPKFEMNGQSTGRSMATRWNCHLCRGLYRIEKAWICNIGCPGRHGLQNVSS